MASIRVRVQADGSRVYQARAPGVPARTFAKERDARLYAADQERRRLMGELYKAPPESFGAFLDGFVDRKSSAGRKPSTIKTLRETAGYLEPLRALTVPEVRRVEVEDLVAAIAARAPRQAQKTLALAKAVLKSARARGQAIDEAVLELDAPAHEEREPRFLTIEELYRLASWMPEYVRRIVPMAGITGMREGELLALEDSALDLDRRRLFVPRGKTRAARRSVDLAEEAVILLREQLLARPVVTRLVFPAPRGGRFERNRFMGRVFRPARRSADLEGVTFHDLRHTAISLMALAGWRPEHIAAQVGHEDGGALIFRRYRHLFAGEMEAQTARLDALIRGGSEGVMDGRRT